MFNFTVYDMQNFPRFSLVALLTSKSSDFRYLYLVAWEYLSFSHFYILLLQPLESIDCLSLVIYCSLKGLLTSDDHFSCKQFLLIIYKPILKPFSRQHPIVKLIFTARV